LVDYQLSARSFEIFEFNLTVIEAHDSLRFRSHANADLYSSAWLERRMREFKQLLQDGCSFPEKPVARLAILPADDVHHLLIDLNQDKMPLDRSALVHRLFEQMVDRNPTGTAVLFEDQSISWSSLDKAANQLAVELVKRGVATDDRVGVCLNRGIELAISFLAVLKAGAGYVPLDPSVPPERISRVLADATASILISTADIARRLDTHPNVVLLDSERATIQANSDARLCHDETASQLAYVIYTSGSTGKPKGVMVEHRNVVSLLVAMERSLGLDSTGVWLSGATVAFDMSVVEILGCLTHGRTLALLGETVLGQVKDPRYTIPELIKRFGVTLYQCTPSQCRALMLDESGREALASLRQLIVSGEPLAPELAEKILRLVHGEVINGYGPTETTVYATMALVRADQPVHIGRPIANTVALILDEHRQLVPFGVVGELYLGGPGVARGYLGKPELTRERFSEIEGLSPANERFYRSGDLVKYLPSGDIFYLGRNDQQVKLRGFRIELGEIESVLLSIKGIRQCAVEAKGDGEQRRLVAYLVLSSDYESDGACRNALRNTLPEYMVPSVFTHLDGLPLTPTGKLDRRALPQPSDTVSDAVDFEVPKDALEARLLEIWQNTLGLKPVSVTAHFFALGGHSLLAVRIFNDIYNEFSVKLPLSTLFECPTVRHLADRLSPLLAEAHVTVAPQWTAVVPMRTRGDLPPLFCVAGLGGNTMNLRYLMDAMGERQPFYGLQHRGVDGVLSPHRKIEDMAREFFEEIRTVQPKGPYYLAGYSAGGLAAYELARILMEHGETIGVVILLDTCNPAILNWPLRKRVSAHFERFAASGVKCLWARTLATTQRRIRDTQRSIRSHLAPFKTDEFRLDVVAQATLEAERSYVPRPLQANVSLLKTDYSVTVMNGIGYPPHESNGWRDVVRGRFAIVQIGCSHSDLVSERVAPTVASILRNSLRDVRANRADGNEF
jgi:amino acid adenylation domain-containing protein